jgi:hypothetical protein
MNNYSLDRVPEFNESEIYSTLELIRTEKVFELDDFIDGFTNFDKIYITSGLLLHITSRELLDKTLEMLYSFGQTPQYDGQFEKFLNKAKISSYTSDDLIRIEAFCYYAFSLYVFQKSFYKVITKDALPLFKLKLVGRNIQVNSDLTFDFIKRQYNQFMIDYIKKIPSVEGQKAEFNKLIYASAEINLKWDSDFFDNSIKNFEILRDNTNITQLSKAPYPFIAVGAFELFKIYVSKYIIDPYLDFGYLKKKLESPEINLISKLTDLQFVDWLKDEDLITQKWFDALNAKGGFNSLKKLEFGHRLNNFNVTFEKLL